MDPKTDYAAWRFWFDIGQYIVAFFVAIYIWLSNRDKARSKDLEDVKESTSKDFKEVENRITKLETSAITLKDLGPVYDRINDIAVDVAKIEGVKDTVDMIQEHLLNNGGTK